MLMTMFMMRGIILITDSVSYCFVFFNTIGVCSCKEPINSCK